MNTLWELDEQRLGVVPVGIIEGGNRKRTVGLWSVDWVENILTFTPADVDTQVYDLFWKWNDEGMDNFSLTIRPVAFFSDSVGFRLQATSSKPGDKVKQLETDVRIAPMVNSIVGVGRNFNVGVPITATFRAVFPVDVDLAVPLAVAPSFSGGCITNKFDVSVVPMPSIGVNVGASRLFEALVSIVPQLEYSIRIPPWRSITQRRSKDGKGRWWRVR